MTSPVLAPVSRIDRALAGLVAQAAGAGAFELFLVVQEGEHRGVDFEVGDILLCRGEAHHGDAVVLAARGHGRPRLGHVRGAHLIGDAGERCLEARWRTAGRVVAIARRTERGWGLDRDLGAQAAPSAGGAVVSLRRSAAPAPAPASPPEGRAVAERGDRSAALERWARAERTAAARAARGRAAQLSLFGAEAA